MYASALSNVDSAGHTPGGAKSVSGNPPVSAPTHLAFLDGLRGVAALWVLLAHCMILGGWYGVPLPTPVIAVDIFMVLSGFLMTYLSLERAAQEPVGSAETVAKFWIRRFFRITPLYFLIIAITFTFGESFKAGYESLWAFNPERWTNPHSLSHAANIRFTLTNLLMHLSYLFGFFPSFSHSVGLPDWSIGLEMQFYAAFPFLFLLLRRIRPLAAALLIVAAGYGARRLTQSVLGHDAFPAPSFLPLKINLFLIGMLMAMGHRQFNRQPMHRALLVVAALSIASMNSIYIVGVTVLIFLMTEESFGDEPLVARVRDLLARLLGNSFTRFLADTSYCVYLVHGLCISFIGGWLYRQPTLLAWKPVERVALLTCVVMVGSYLAAYILHQSVERPGIKLGQALIKRLLPAANTGR